VVSVDFELADTVHVLTGALPDGTVGDEVGLLLPMASLTGGYIATGLQTGLGATSVPVVANPPAVVVVGLVQSGGFGSGGGMSTSVAEVGVGTVVMPPWIAIPGLPVVYPEDKTIGLDTDPTAQIVLATVVDRQQSWRDLIAPAGLALAAFPALEASFERGHTTWDLRVVSTDATTFEEILGTVPATRDALAASVVGVSSVRGEVSATGSN
jgi:hypothetical protein